MPRSRKRKKAEEKSRNEKKIRMTTRAQEIGVDLKKLDALERKLKAKNKETK